MTDFDAALAHVDPQAYTRLVQLEKDLGWDPNETADGGEAKTAPPEEASDDSAAAGDTTSEKGTVGRARPVIPPMESVRAWLSAEHVQARATAKWEGRLHLIEALRNILTLAPLIFTWYNLSAAAYNFGYIATHNLVASEQSFLTLWQSGFEGKAQIPVQSFSDVAHTDVILFISLLSVTLVYQLAVWWMNERALAIGDLANERLAQLTIRVETWRADDAQRRMRDALISALGGTAENFAGLLTDVQDQRKSLEKMTASQFEGLANLSATAAAMHEGAERFATHTEKMEELAAAIEHSSTPLAKAAESLTGLRSEITGATKGLMEQSGNLAEAVTTFLGDHGATRTGLEDLRKALMEYGAAAASRFARVEAAANERRAEAEKQIESLEATVRQQRAAADADFKERERKAQQQFEKLEYMVDAFLRDTRDMRLEAENLHKDHTRRIDELNQQVKETIEHLSPRLENLNGGVMRLDGSVHGITELLAEMLEGLAGENGERPGAYLDGA